MKIAKLIARTARRVVRDVTDAPRVSRELRTLRAATPARVPAPLTAGQIKGEVPAVADIEAAARQFEQARTDANAAARAKRAAEKILKRTPDGQYGAVVVERFESSRQVADLDAIRTLFAEHGLGDIPMKSCAPSLALTFTAADTGTEPAESVLQLVPAA
ncbi:hypothetical protein [Actinomadura macrotermitis]|uniref:Uncharacterized protein n=1 Tax=Actinomadura macrotermitis TaxID=2585200 RepID=A0A7K0BTD0_9ACTN|nr:hypothetical protein [Actinomadura macrotermitis]MQY04152.1 hypothetical protein [Actinomadura macrotermitis]